MCESEILCTGARSGEIRNLRYDEIDFEQQQIHVWSRKRKNVSKQ